MCGIVAYVGERTAYPILVKGLQRLEYRGYDSAGVALIDEELRVYKCKGKVKDLEACAKGKPISGSIGMGHTRWATHGEPNDRNAHPHVSQGGIFTLVHNGIIENYAQLKSELQELGYQFNSDTDSEVLVNLIENIYLSKGVNAEMAIRLALTKVIGAYGIVVSCTAEKGRLVAARKGSPLVIGVGEGEYFLASDATPIVEYTDKVIYMNDEEVAIIEPSGIELKNIHDDAIEPTIQKINLTIGDIGKGGYEHFMLKEIHEQPISIEDTFRGRVAIDHSKIFLGGIADVIPELLKARRIIILACGTSWHAGIVGEYLIEDFARIPVEVEYASEFRYRNPVIHHDDVILAISQSGETADTLAAVRMAKESGATVLGICNVAGSSLSRETNAGVYTHAGMEIGVASTKAFTSQVTVLTMISLLLGHKKGLLADERYKHLIEELSVVPNKIRRILEQEELIKGIAKQYKDAISSLFLGRGYLFAVALEGALKLKEISYIHAEGYPAAEMKHGPIALINESLPVFFIATKDKYYEKNLSNIQEVKARNGKVIAIVSEGDSEVKNIADSVIEIPACEEAITPLLATIPLQLIAYHVAVMRGCDVDQPRNLAKSVTVE